MAPGPRAKATVLLARGSSGKSPAVELAEDPSRGTLQGQVWGCPRCEDSPDRHLGPGREPGGACVEGTDSVRSPGSAGTFWRCVQSSSHPCGAQAPQTRSLPEGALPGLGAPLPQWPAELSARPSSHCLEDPLRPMSQGQRNETPNLPGLLVHVNTSQRCLVPAAQPSPGREQRETAGVALQPLGGPQ